MAKKDAKKDSGKSITVEQVASANRKPAIQQQTLIGLGLNKIRRTSTLQDTPCGARHDRQVAHLVRVVE